MASTNPGALSRYVDTAGTITADWDADRRRDFDVRQ